MKPVGNLAQDRAPSARLRAGYVPLGIGVAMAIWPLLSGPSYVVYIATIVMIYVIGALGLHLVLRMGQMSIGHGAFMGIGAYTSTLLVMSAGLPWVLSFVAAGLLSAAVAAVIGPIILRLRGVFFSLVTFTFGEIVRLAMIEWRGLTGGSPGIAQVPPPFEAAAQPLPYYYLVLGCAALAFLLVWRILRSDIGNALDSIAVSDGLAEANGVPTRRLKIAIFVLACGMVGIAGSLQAHFIHFISPDSYTFKESVQFILINVIGGATTIWGPVLGSIFIVAFPEMLRSWVEYQWLIYGIVLVALMAYLPGGLMEVVHKVSRRIKLGTRRDG